MAIVYTWKVTGLKTSSVQGTNNVIVQTYWEKIGKDGTLEGKFTGATPFDPSQMPEGTTFTAFEKLTEDKVLEWIKATVVGTYEEHVNAQIIKQIDEKRTPLVDATLPWTLTSNTK